MPTLRILTSQAAAGVIDALASLRLEIFREYPYLYDGKRENELNYLRLYAEAPDACLITCTEGARIIGAATGVPLRYVQPELGEVFAPSGFASDEIYYVGELLFYPEFRHQGTGLKIVSLLEDHIRAMGHYKYLTCATVLRPHDHPARPEDFIPIDRFLARCGFMALSGISTSFTWLEVDGEKREHVMKFWIKELFPQAVAPDS